MTYILLASLEICKIVDVTQLLLFIHKISPGCKNINTTTTVSTKYYHSHLWTMQ